MQWSKLTNYKTDTNISISIKEINQAPKYAHKIKKYKAWKQKHKIVIICTKNDKVYRKFTNLYRLLELI